MIVRWFCPEDYYVQAGHEYIFYPSLYARGYRFTEEDRAAMDGVLESFLSWRLRIEFLVWFCLVTFTFLIAVTGFLVTASNQELDVVLATPPWVWLVGAVGLAGVIVVPIVFRLRSKIGRQLEEMGLEASEPPRPDFFIVDGKVSLMRVSCVLAAVSAVLALAGNLS